MVKGSILEDMLDSQYSVGIFTFYRSYLLATFGVRASKDMHANLLSSILQSTDEFLRTHTPTGRILSRFSKDMHTIDQELSELHRLCSLYGPIGILATVATIAFVTPWFTRGPPSFRIPLLQNPRTTSVTFPARRSGLKVSRGRRCIHTFRKPLVAFQRFVRMENQMHSSASLKPSWMAVYRAVYCNKSGERWLSTRLDMVGAVYCRSGSHVRNSSCGGEWRHWCWRKHELFVIGWPVAHVCHSDHRRASMGCAFVCPSRSCNECNRASDLLQRTN
jgi:hypothetical protein